MAQKLKNSSFTLVTLIKTTSTKNGASRFGWIVSTPWQEVFILGDLRGDYALREALLGETYEGTRGSNEASERFTYATTGTTTGPTINVAPSEFKRLQKEYAHA